MHPEPDHRHYVRRVVLPSGKTIEVVYFDEPSSDAPSPLSPTPARLDDLHVCLHCDSELVYPVEWQEAGPDHWEVTLRCPNCEARGTDVFHQDIVERFDEQLDRGTEALVRDLKRLMHANMEDEIDRFVAALDAGFIIPDDF